MLISYKIILQYVSEYVIINVKILKVGVKMFVFPPKPTAPLNRYTEKEVTDFVIMKKKQNHSVYELRYYDIDKLCTLMFVDFTDKTLVLYNYETDLLCTAFGRNLEPTWAEFMEFLEDRCIPRARPTIQSYLDAIGVYEYDPVKIVKVTNGRMAEDSQWLTLEEC